MSAGAIVAREANHVHISAKTSMQLTLTDNPATGDTQSGHGCKKQFAGAQQVR